MHSNADSDKEVAVNNLSHADCAQYEKDGCLIYPHQVIPDHTITMLLSRVEAVFSGDFDTGIAPVGMVDVGDEKRIQRVTQIHLADKAFGQLVRSADIGRLAAQMTGAREVRVWGTQLYFKPAGSGLNGQVGFHQDSQHMPCFAGDVFTAWLPLTNILKDSGPLIYVKGSHHVMRPLLNSGGHIQNIDQQRKRLQRELVELEWAESEVTIPAGAISFHHHHLIHGSGANTSDVDRCVLAIGLFTERSRFVEGVEDYGIAALINNPDACPVIYRENNKII